MSRLLRLSVGSAFALRLSGRDFGRVTVYPASVVGGVVIVIIVVVIVVFIVIVDDSVLG